MTNRTLKNRHGSAVITLPSETEILITRDFDAAADLIFTAYTTPELVKRWWGFDTSKWLVCDIDLKVGGRWRYLIEEPDGAQVGFHGEYSEVAGPHRLVTTEVFEGFPPDPTVDEGAVNVVTLEEKDGVTTLTVLVQCPSQDVRDIIIDSGMEGGMQVSYNRLEDVVTGTKA